ncbi:hypothetical protein COLO4_28726 [Corchorus olitorius]|uniref:Uncharacterized protein n=1 Tax=Corchorus olitorius TaxID=93759 RepID=A0A1R3HIJ1_9ROSI|nr:hypothetical protein COLO4_28726 [Corchorus olitorius]
MFFLFIGQFTFRYDSFERVPATKSGKPNVVNINIDLPTCKTQRVRYQLIKRADKSKQAG